MNPYDFVPIDFNNHPNRQRPVQHEKFHRNTVSGSLTARITAETPLFIKQGNTEYFIKNRASEYIIPGTSLKGLFRCIVETVANGCFGGKFDGRYKDRQRGWADHRRKLPISFKSCTDPEHLCIACRTFGMLGENKVFTGKVSFQDAVCNTPITHPTIITVDLMGPKPHHTAFYIKNNKIAGRKFYFHHPQGLKTSRVKTNYNQRINPLDKDSQFTFTASFTNLKDDEWWALLYAIVLEPDMRHKIGYAKPSGLGSVRIEIEHIRLIDYAARYTSPNRGVTERTATELADYIAEQIYPFTGNIASPTLVGLRRIWRWNPHDSTPYRYPTAVDRNWFHNNPREPLHNTP